MVAKSKGDEWVQRSGSRTELKRKWGLQVGQTGDHPEYIWLGVGSGLGREEGREKATYTGVAQLWLHRVNRTAHVSPLVGYRVPRKPIQYQSVDGYLSLQITEPSWAIIWTVL